VPIRPLTLVVGKNSSGKSSFVRWLPLLKQSLYAPGRSLVAWAPRFQKIVDYGSFRETLREGADPAEIGWGYRWDDDEMSVVLEDVPTGVRVKSSRLLVKGDLILEGRDGKVHSLKPEFKIKNKNESNNVYSDNEVSHLSNRNRVLIELREGWKSILNRLDYIAPFRVDPIRGERSPGPTDVIGTKGEAMLSFLQGLNEERQESLVAWLEQWLGISIKIENIDPYFELKIKQGDRWDNIVDVGYGIGQVLPVVVQIWHSQQKTEEEDFDNWVPESPTPKIVIIEQPELHLHPAHQAALAKMFVSVAQAHAQNHVLQMIETHSDVILSTVGELIEQQKISHEDVQVVFFDRPEGKGDAIVRLVNFDEKGYLQEPWPIGFFTA
jgi:predicted ATPase